MSINRICIGYILRWLTTEPIQQNTQLSVAHYTHKCATHTHTQSSIIDIRYIDYNTDWHKYKNTCTHLSIQTITHIDDCWLIRPPCIHKHIERKRRAWNVISRYLYTLRIVIWWIYTIHLISKENVTSSTEDTQFSE